MAFGFGGGLSVDRDLSRGGSFGGSNIGRGLGVGGRSDRDGGSNQDSFFERQRKRERERQSGADLSGFRPGVNPELGGSTKEDSNARQAQAEAIERATGSALAAFARGDLATGLELTARNVGQALGVNEEIARDPATGAWGTRATLQPVSLLGALPVGMGFTQALAALNAFGPFSAAQVATNALGMGRTVRAAGGMLPGVDLGFRPTTGTVNRANARAAAGESLTAVDQMARDFATRREAAIAANRASRDAGRGDPSPVVSLTEPLPIAPVPTQPGAAPTAQRGFGRLSGRDPRIGIDLLRTGEQAAVAAGVRPARPTLSNPLRPPRLGRLI